MSENMSHKALAVAFRTGHFSCQPLRQGVTREPSSSPALGLRGKFPTPRHIMCVVWVDTYVKLFGNALIFFKSSQTGDPKHPGH